MLTTFYITFQLIYYIVIRVGRLGVKHYHLKLSLIQLNPLIKLRDLSCRRTVVLKCIYSYPFPFFFTHNGKHPLIRTLRMLAAKQNQAGSYMWVTVKLRWTFQVNQGVWGLVYMYPFLLENGYFFPSVWTTVPAHVSGENGHRKRIFSKNALQSEDFWKLRLKIVYLWTDESGVFEYDDVIHQYLVAWRMLNKGCYRILIILVFV